MSSLHFWEGVLRSIGPYFEHFSSATQQGPFSPFLLCPMVSGHSGGGLLPVDICRPTFAERTNADQDICRPDIFRLYVDICRSWHLPIQTFADRSIDRISCYSNLLRVLWIWDKRQNKTFKEVESLLRSPTLWCSVLWEISDEFWVPLNKWCLKVMSNAKHCQPLSSTTFYCR